MFYKQFLKIIELNKDFVEEFDYWLTTLPKHLQKNITASAVSSRMEVSYSVADTILEFSFREGILNKHYLIKCPVCGTIIGLLNKEEIIDVLREGAYCEECDADKTITTDNVITAYEVAVKPDVTEDEIAKAIEGRLNLGGEKENFLQADSLSYHIDDLYEMFYSPNESAYKEFSELRTKLDLDYGTNTTEKGASLERLILRMFNEIKYIRGTNKIKTLTNQFDCTLLCGVKTVELSVFDYLRPYFIVECKNEKKKPDNTYLNKIESIMDTNDAKFGIVFGRQDATDPCFSISREHYLVSKNTKKQQIVITCSDKDLDYLINKKVNLLKYMEFKIFQVTSNSPKSRYEDFLE